MKYYSIDRFEENFAVCIDDDGHIYNFEKKNLPKQVKEGDVLIMCSSKKFVIDIEETKKRRKKIYELNKKLFEN